MVHRNHRAIIRLAEDTMKTIKKIKSAPGGHWVGDGFPVRSLFSYQGDTAEISPFLMFDFAGPYHFDPAASPRGVGAHPHKGFETVSIVFDGEVSHRDSAGHGGTIGPGDVQWMTAGQGIVHQEFHSEAFTRSGGTFHMAQLWVNLKASDKSAPPGYQALTAAAIPVVDLPHGAGTVRLIAGDFDGQKGAARTFTPMRVWDVTLAPGGEATLTTPAAHNTLLVPMTGTATVNGGERLAEADLALFNHDGDSFTLASVEGARLLLLSGEPIAEPVVGYGPFVMNSQAEIRQAITDYNAGRFGEIAG
jgi:hypothetical protein